MGYFARSEGHEVLGAAAARFRRLAASCSDPADRALLLAAAEALESRTAGRPADSDLYRNVDFRV